MITELTITPEYGDSLTLSVPGPTDGYLVKEIEGLDPVPVSLASTTVASMEGEVYQSSRLEKRNIVLKIKLITNYAASSISARRNYLTSLFLAKKSVVLGFDRVDGEYVTIEGRIEDIEAPTSTEDPLVTISIICFNPDFVGSEEHFYEGQVDGTPVLLNYEGTVPAPTITTLGLPSEYEDDGFDLLYRHVDTDRVIGAFALTSPVSDTSPSMSFIVDSTPGNKKAIREHNQTSLLPLSNFDDIIWPSLITGEFEFTASPISGVVKTDWPVTVRWNNRYGAI